MSKDYDMQDDYNDQLISGKNYRANNDSFVTGIEYPNNQSISKHSIDTEADLSKRYESDEASPTSPSSLDPSVLDQLDKYFGFSAHEKFHDRYQWLVKQRNIMHSSVHEKSTELYFNNEEAVNYEDLSCITNLTVPSSNSTLSRQNTASRQKMRQNSNIRPNTTMSTSSRMGSLASKKSTSPKDSSSIVSNLSLSNLQDNSRDLSETLPEESISSTITPRSKYIIECLREKVNPRASLLLRKKFTIHLNLQNQRMGNKMATILSDSLKELPLLESLDISNNNISESGLSSIIKSIKNITTLYELNLSKNCINDNIGKLLVDYIEDVNCPLQKLNVSECFTSNNWFVKFINVLNTDLKPLPPVISPPIRRMLSNASSTNISRSNSSIQQTSNDVFTVSKSKITYLDASHNNLGEESSHSSLVTTGNSCIGALANLLRTSDCSLETLKLSWNTIRLDGAVDFARSLSVNSSLTHLDLSFNALGHDGGEALGDAILDNRTLRTLLLSTNSIDSTACFTICVGVLENLALRHVCLDGNPIGERGAQALMLVPLIAGTSSNPCGSYTLQLHVPHERAIACLILHITSLHCHYSIKSMVYERPHVGKASAKKQKPEVIDLIQQPLFHLIPLSASSNSSSTAFSCQSISYEKSSQQANERKKLISALKKIIQVTSNTSRATSLFSTLDFTGAGTSISRHALTSVLSQIGLEVEEYKINDLMLTYDHNDSDHLELSEFLAFLRLQCQEAVDRLKDLTELPIIAVASAPGVRYVPPRIGTLQIEVVKTTALKSHSHTLSTPDLLAINNNINLQNQSVESYLRIAYFIQNSKIRVEEALQLYRYMIVDSGSMVKAAVLLIPKMVRVTDAHCFLNEITKNNKLLRQQIILELGSLLRPLLGMHNGHYILNLTKEVDRLCLERLLLLNGTLMTLHSHPCRFINSSSGSSIKFDINVGDTSQKGNNSCFRNEIVNGVPMAIDPSLFTPMPKSGKVEFDFSGGYRPSDSDLQTSPSFATLTDARCIKLLLYLGLLPKSQSREAKTKLKEWQEETWNHCFRSVTAVDLPRAEDISATSSLFYEKIKFRGGLVSQAIAEEELTPILTRNILFALKFPDAYAAEREASLGSSSLALNRGSATHLLTGKPDLNNPTGGAVAGSGMIRRQASSTKLKRKNSARTPGNAALVMSMLQKGITGDPSGEHHDSPAPMLGNFARSSPAVSSARSMTSLMAGSRDCRLGLVTVGAPMTLLPGLTKWEHRSAELSLSTKDILSLVDVPVRVKAAQIWSALTSKLSRVWILSRHLAFILECFPYGDCQRTKYFGSYKVELVVSLFYQIVDLQNFELVLRVLTPQEVACVTCRIGWLNIFNPLKPEGGYQLDLSHWDERQVTKILMALSNLEAYRNCRDVTLRDSRTSVAAAPDWLNPKIKINYNTLPTTGILTLYYENSITLEDMSLALKEFGTSSHNISSDDMDATAAMLYFRRSLLELVMINDHDFELELQLQDTPSSVTSNRSNTPNIIPTTSTKDTIKETRKEDVRLIWNKLFSNHFQLQNSGTKRYTA